MKDGCALDGVDTRVPKLALIGEEGAEASKVVEVGVFLLRFSLKGIISSSSSEE